MDIYEAIKTRVSVRNYKPDDVPEEVLQRLLNAMRLAPSAANKQPFKFIVIRDKAVRAALVPPCRNKAFIGEAPVVIAACGWEDLSYPRMGGYWKSLPLDVGIVLDHLSLAAVAEGLGTCWIGAFDEAQAKTILGVPPEARLIALMTVGYPSKPTPSSPRKDLKEIISRDRW